MGWTFFNMLKFQLSRDSFSLWVDWLSISRFHEWVYCLLSIRSVNSSSKGHLFINACFTQRIFVECIMTCASPRARSPRLKLKLDRLREDGLHRRYCINADRDMQTTVTGNPTTLDSLVLYVKTVWSSIYRFSDMKSWLNLYFHNACFWFYCEWFIGVFIKMQ